MMFTEEGKSEGDVGLYVVEMGESRNSCLP